jgi:hypothetical protein
MEHLLHSLILEAFMIHLLCPGGDRLVEGTQQQKAIPNSREDHRRMADSAWLGVGRERGAKI